MTLVELLISIAIIAVLIGILLPVLGSVREQARQTKCLANNRQIALGWIVYTDEHEVFPHGEPVDVNEDGVLQGGERSLINLWWDWGGVDWFAEDPTTRLNGERPLNPYIGSESLEVKARAEIFRCPSDTGQINARGERSDLPALEALSESKESRETTFGLRGTSYQANEWIWCEIGSIGGYHHRWPDYKFITDRNRGFDVTEPHDFVLVGDAGAMWAGRWIRDIRGIAVDKSHPGGPARGWWHGFEQCNFAYFDGSARHVTMEPGVGATDDYTFYLNRARHEPWSVAQAWNGIGAKPPPK